VEGNHDEQDNEGGGDVELARQKAHVYSKHAGSPRPRNKLAAHPPRNLSNYWGLAHVDEQWLHVVKEQGDEHDEDGDEKLSAHQVDAALLQHSASVALTHEHRATVDEAQGNAKRDDVVEGDAEPDACEQVRVIQVANEVEAYEVDTEHQHHA